MGWLLVRGRVEGFDLEAVVGVFDVVMVVVDAPCYLSYRSLLNPPN